MVTITNIETLPAWAAKNLKAYVESVFPRLQEAQWSVDLHHLLPNAQLLIVVSAVVKQEKGESENSWIIRATQDSCFRFQTVPVHHKVEDIASSGAKVTVFYRSGDKRSQHNFNLTGNPLRKK